jgi:hypothetical protein
MARRRRMATGIDSYEDLARKTRILEQELALQQQALERLKQMSAGPKHDPAESTQAASKTA